MARPPRPWGKGFFAACGTFIWPGVGQILVGRWRAALFWSIGFAVCQLISLGLMLTARFVIVGVVVAAIEATWFVAALVHAFIAGRRCPRSLGPIWAGYAGGGLLLALALILEPNMRIARYFNEHHLDKYVIRSMSMSPTLIPGDRFILNYRLPPQRWSLVVFDQPEMGAGVPFVCRLVGLPGEQSEIRQGVLTIDGQPVTPPSNAGPYLEIPYQGVADSALGGRPCAGCDGNPVRLGPDEYYLLGDNSELAKDSRLWEIPIDGHARGVLPAAHLQPGRVTAIYWPPSRWRIIDP